MPLLIRLLQAAAVVFVVATLSFLMVHIVPGKFHDLARVEADASPAAIEAWREQAGEKRPLHVRYAAWIAGMVHGDLGQSFAYGRPVAELVVSRAARTITLTVSALAIAWTFGVWWGVWAAFRGGWSDRIGAAISASLLSMPEIAVGFGLLLLASRWQWVGAVELRDFGLPLLTLILSALPAVWRQTRASMLQAQTENHVRAAIAHGLPRWRIAWRWALPAAANPLISMFGLSVGSLLSASLVVEVIFGWPGIGPLFIDAISNRDTYLVLGVVVSSAVLLAAGNLLGDLLLYWCDPRIRRP